MYKTVVGDFRDVVDAEVRVNDLLSMGYPKDCISVIANKTSAKTMRDTGVAVEMDFDYIDDVSDETLWQRIKSFFGFGTDRVNDVDVTQYAGSIRAGHVLVLLDEALVPPQLRDAWKNAEVDTCTMKHAAKNAPDGGTIRLEEERMQVNKKAVEVGEAVVHKHVTESTETVEVPVRHEEVIIERVPVVDGADTVPDFKDETITIPVMEEQVEVSKKPVVTEEIRIHKRAVDGTKSVSESLKKEELDVEKSGNVAIKDKHKIPG